MLPTFVVLTLLGLGLVAVGRWGRSHEGRLASGWMDPTDQARRERVYRRGALTCSALGVFFVLLAVALAVSQVPGL